MPPDDIHDRLSPGVARLAGGDDTDADSTPVRIVPIPEGETTTGLSNEPTYWGRDVLQDAVDSGAFDGAKLLKSPGGVGHKDMEALADPDNIVGSVEGAHYEEGVGPVLEGDLLDEHLSTLVDKGLVGVSPDLYRRLGEYDEERGAKPAEEIVDVPYITILDRGASDGATIEPASAEALAESPAGRYLEASAGTDVTVEQLASMHEPQWSGTEETAWSKPAMEDFDTDDLGDIDDHFIASVTGFPPDQYGDLKLPVVGPDGSLNLEALRSAHRLASQTGGLTQADVGAVRTRIERIAEAAFDVDLSPESEQNADAEQLAGLHTLRFDAYGEMFGDEFLDAAVEGLNGLAGVTATRTSANTDPTLLAVVDPAAVDVPPDTLNERIIGALADTPFEVSETFDWLDRIHDRLAQASDEGAESSTGPTDADTDPTMGDDDKTKEELREQLAAAKAEVNEKTEQIDDLEDEREELAEEVEQKDERIDELESEVEPTREMLASRLADGAPVSAETIADSNRSNDELAAELAEANGLETDDDSSPVEAVMEQMAQSPSLRGGSEPSQTGPGGGGELSSEQLAAANGRARGVMTASEVMGLGDRNPRDHIKQQHGVDPAEYDSEQALRQAIDDGGDD